MAQAGDPTLPQLLGAVAQRNPGAPAVYSEHGNINYGQLAGMAKGLGACFAGLTDKPVVAMFLPMSTGFVGAFFGAGFAGKAALPLNMLLGGEDLAYILADAGADLIVTLGLFKEKLSKLPAKVVALEELKPTPEQVAASKATPPKPDDIAILLYTSGTTGKPKGVELTHRNLTSNALAAVECMDFHADYKVLACLPTFHTFAITATMLAPLAAGASLYALPRFEPGKVHEAAAKEKCSVLMMVPSMYRLVARMQERNKLPLEHLKLAVSGGEPLPQDLAEKFEQVFGLPLLEGYGQTESAPIISFNRPHAHKAGTVGQPIPGVKVAIVDPESGKDLPAGQVGEIRTHGPHVMRGYHNRPEETAKVLTKDGWLRTGDMGMLDAEGYLTITGRLREMIKVAGEMVFPAEVENALLQHPKVFEAGVIGMQDPKRGESVKAFVALAEGQEATADELLEHCRKLLPVYKVPRAVEFRKELPKGPTGKVIRRLLQ